MYRILRLIFLDILVLGPTERHHISCHTGRHLARTHQILIAGIASGVASNCAKSLIEFSFNHIDLNVLKSNTSCIFGLIKTGFIELVCLCFLTQWLLISWAHPPLWHLERQITQFQISLGALKFPSCWDRFRDVTHHKYLGNVQNQTKNLLILSRADQTPTLILWVEKIHI